MAVLPIGISGEEGGYQIERSLRFNSADSAYLSWTPASAGNRKTWTFSAWVKRGGISLASTTTIFAAGPDGSNPRGIIDFDNTDQLRFGVNDGTWYTAATTAVFRDPSAWYHIVAQVDFSNATQSNRVKLYVNGVQQATNSVSWPSTDQVFNNTVSHQLGRNQLTGTSYFNGYLTEVNFIDGSALTASDFGEYNTDTGVWQPKAYSGSYGTNGFYLDFADNSSTTALGYDAAGSNDWTPNNFSVTAGAGNDSLVDTPTPYGTDTGVGGEVRGNYATFNPINKDTTATLSNGNLQASASTSAVALSNWAIPDGKWYAEFNITTAPSSGWAYIGTNSPTALYVYRSSDGQFYNNSGYVSYGASYTTGDVIGVAIDMTNGTLEYFKNGTSQGQLTGLSFGVNPWITVAPTTASVTGTINANFGQRPFAYTAASGFKALCTTNLPEPTIADGGNYFNAVLYTGDGSSSRDITDVGFAPDWVWIKDRSNARSHRLFDVIRGAGKRLVSNGTDAESTQTDELNAFLSNGFNIGSGTAVNNASETYVAWNWKANGSGVSNTDGSITSTVSANTTAGFSIVTYTGNGTSGATVGHGLGATPNLIIVKRRNSASNWTIYSSVLGATKYLYLNTTNAEGTASVFWNNTAPTSTLITLGDDGYVNANGSTYVAYCFAPIAGYSAFGSFVGNGSADGPFIFTGHRPSYVLIKRTSATEDWAVFDSTRNPSNLTNLLLSPNLSSAETTVTGNPIDILSNGFKIRGTGNTVNGSGSTYVYACFAENPFKYSLAR